MIDLRFEVAQQLDELQPELLDSVTSVAGALDDYKDEILRRYRQIRGAGKYEGRAVIVLTAGAPGAGKSTALKHLPDGELYRDIDADELKTVCLQVAQCAGILDSWLGMTLADGNSILRGELSTLVQDYSVALADELEFEAMFYGENIIRQGTFKWEGLPAQYLKRLDEVGGYAGYQLFCVEIGQKNALDGALSRWWGQRVTSDPNARYLPPTAITDLYESDDSRYSSSLHNALRLFNNPESERYAVASLTVRDRTNPALPVALEYQYSSSFSVSIDDIAADVDQKRQSEYGEKDNCSSSS